jgi:hypothetical protein
MTAAVCGAALQLVGSLVIDSVLFEQQLPALMVSSVRRCLIAFRSAVNHRQPPVSGRWSPLYLALPRREHFTRVNN